MYYSDLRFIQPFIDEKAQLSEDYSTPIPLSFFASLSAALTIDKNGYLPNAPIASPSVVNLGRLLAKSYVKNPREIKPLSILKHSKLTTFTNVSFKPDNSDNLSNPYSHAFKSRFLLTVPSEWRSIIYSRKIRSLRADGYRFMADTIYNRLTGKLPYYISPETLLDFAEQLLALYKQAGEDIYIIDSHRRNNFISPKKKALLVSTYPHVQNAKPVLEKIIDNLKTYNTLPIEKQSDVLNLADIITTVPLIAATLPMHQGLLRCLFPYIASLVDEKIILPVCPSVLEPELNSTLNRQVKQDLSLTESPESPESPELAEPSSSDVSSVPTPPATSEPVS